MNLYILVEGKTERRVYPKLLAHFLPSFSRVDHATDAIKNNYYLISGNGYPSILDDFLTDSVNDINYHGHFNYFIIAIDTDDSSSEEKKQEVHHYIKENNIQLNNKCQLVVITQKICLETWFLGNKKIYARSSQEQQCAKFSKHFDISKKDPEKMQKDSAYQGTNAHFHFEYLKTMLAEKNIKFSKKRAANLLEKHYIEALQDRLQNDKNALNSLRYFFDFLNDLSVITD